jgi:hypothetical protein
VKFWVKTYLFFHVLILYHYLYLNSDLVVLTEEWAYFSYFLELLNNLPKTREIHDLPKSKTSLFLSYIRAKLTR